MFNIYAATETETETENGRRMSAKYEWNGMELTTATHTDEKVKQLAEYIFGHVAIVHVLVIGGKILDQQSQSGVVCLLR